MEIITSRTNHSVYPFPQAGLLPGLPGEVRGVPVRQPQAAAGGGAVGPDRHSGAVYTEGGTAALVRPRPVVRVTESVMRSVSPMETPQGVYSPPDFHRPAGASGARDGICCWTGSRIRAMWVLFSALPTPLAGRCCCCRDARTSTTPRPAGRHGGPVPPGQPCLPLWSRAAELVKGAGLPLYATALMEDTADVRDVDLSATPWSSARGRGISKEALALCGRTVKIPMRDTQNP